MLIYVYLARNRRVIHLNSRPWTLKQKNWKTITMVDWLFIVFHSFDCIWNSTIVNVFVIHTILFARSRFFFWHTIHEFMFTNAVDMFLGALLPNVTHIIQHEKDVDTILVCQESKSDIFNVYINMNLVLRSIETRFRLYNYCQCLWQDTYAKSNRIWTSI
jgi:hypothetical protein